MKQILLIDVGNTCTKFKIYNNIEKKFKQSHTMKTNEFITSSDLGMQKIETWIFDTVIYSSVNSVATKILEDFLTRNNILHTNVFKQAEIARFEKLHQGMGADLIAYYYGAQKYGNNNLVIALGTATTFNLIVNNFYQGVIIAPGVKSALDGLFTAADGLNYEKYLATPTNKLVGNITNEAIWLGAIKGHYHMINSFINELKTNYKIDNIIISGGNANYMMDLIKNNNWIYDEDLLFSGLINLMKYHN